jgi:hypothetical protein
MLLHAHLPVCSAGSKAGSRCFCSSWIVRVCSLILVRAKQLCETVRKSVQVT